jgi:ABC-2 type transport system ATP-binding protein
MIHLKALSKSFGKNEVLKSINQVFEPGKIYGIVGENGAGKTTLFKCIAGMENHSGEINAPYHPIKNHIGFLETNPVFMSYITGWEYLKLLSIARHEVEENFEEQNIFDLPLGEYAENYSTGMKKKLALMAILLQKNQIYILDEPFNGVDIHSNMIISGIIKRLRELGKTVLISSHIFSSLREHCDEILLLSEGQFTQNVTAESFDKLEKEMIERSLEASQKRLKIG